MSALTRITRAWREMDVHQHLAAGAAVALLLTMFFPWYGLQSLNRKTGAIYSHSINAFGDVSFVEAAVFLVAVGVLVMLFARAEGRSFQLPGGDGTIVLIAGAWAGLLIFYRVFSRPSGHGYPVGIEWGFFLAFVAAGALAYAGWRMRAAQRPEPPARRTRRPPRRGSPDPDLGEGTAVQPRQRPPRAAPVPARERSPYPPAPPEQLSFEDPPTRRE
ncbi:MAG TPA: hypothetical protein VGN08_00945 [Solirubrobacteraceae bacterium]|jgi:hypothetical protein